MSIQQFRANLSGSARPNQFRAQLIFPAFVQGGTEAGQKSQFLCNGAELPGSTIFPITVPYRGRTIHYAGDRQFAPWTVTVINDGDFAIKNAFERWMNAIDSHSSSNGLVVAGAYQVDMFVQQLDKNDQVLKEYKMVNVWPTDLSGIQLNFGAENQLEEFQVTLQYDYWTSDTTV